ncbi:Formate hydrogenlyase subunit 5 [Methylacidiphilum infernorum V4]|uniref:Formate hydrogenlyase subunit 5 n=2 Tax=Methylacidiphilum infernorum (isolate V4) TaxID=481448 RepID=B3DZF5_METI4|nr:Formate hydrogenlyase subunit 5 [Methylacidiphilum infernorum V4]
MFLPPGSIFPPGSSNGSNTARYCSSDFMKKLTSSSPSSGLLTRVEPREKEKFWSFEEIEEKRWLALGREPLKTEFSLFGLWGAPQTVYLALLDRGGSKISLFGLQVPEGKFPSVAVAYPSAARLERALYDLFGLQAQGSLDSRPWLDHGKWGVRFPMGDSYPDGEEKLYSFFPARGESLHQVPVGPVHAGIIEPGHFRFTMSGEIVVRMEERLGYTHKGIESLFSGASIDKGMEIAGRISGDSTVAYAYGYALAVEEALGISPPPRAEWIRALMAELERMANHFGDVGAICNDAAFPRILSRCALLREKILRCAQSCFGHRLMRDKIVVGGVKEDLNAEGLSRIRELLETIKEEVVCLKDFYDSKNSLQDRTVGTGVLDRRLAELFGAGGFIGRASGRNFDSRKAFAYKPYDSLSFEVPVLEDGDVNARVWIRILEIEQSVKLLEQILEGMPPGSICAERIGGEGSGKGLSVVESFRGDILTWIEIYNGKIIRCHPRDPSWFQWPLLEKVIVGGVIADFPLCNKSFNCSYSGHDL